MNRTGVSKKYGKSDLIFVAILAGSAVYYFKGIPIENWLLGIPVLVAIAGIWYVVIMLAEPIGTWLRDRFPRL